MSGLQKIMEMQIMKKLHIFQIFAFKTFDSVFHKLFEVSLYVGRILIQHSKQGWCDLDVAWVTPEDLTTQMVPH